MGNLLTPGLLGASMAAAANIIMGEQTVSWNIFLSAMVAIALNLDMGDSRIGPGSPFCHSIAGIVALTYLAGVLAYCLTVLGVIELGAAVGLALAVGLGSSAHLLAELAGGETAFTFPRRLDPVTWFEEAGPSSDRLWVAWGRVSTGGRRLADTGVNALSVTLLLLCIWLA